jgi:hypothetical protein
MTLTRNQQHFVNALWTRGAAVGLSPRIGLDGRYKASIKPLEFAVFEGLDGKSIALVIGTDDGERVRTAFPLERLEEMGAMSECELNHMVDREFRRFLPSDGDRS